MLKKLLIIAILVFIFGWVAGNVYSQSSSNYVKKPFSVIKAERISPFDHISEDQIYVYNDRIILEIPDATWAQFTDTNSMDPIIDIGSNSIEIMPKQPSDIHIGDIISYESGPLDAVIIHRVIDVGEDKDGPYYILKGDNNLIQDPEKVRFDQVRGLVVAVIY
ncbi:signal peptidase I [Candidatus Woesearchaeota archaeon]|nr:signal peptidase I [Candidatus Woesearchaeota archaeon]MBW3021616.1 signal peptidase I [Candidatus Woesearchaeota archaeon]